MFLDSYGSPGFAFTSGVYSWPGPFLRSFFGLCCIFLGFLSKSKLLFFGDGRVERAEEVAGFA